MPIMANRNIKYFELPTVDIKKLLYDDLRYICVGMRLTNKFENKIVIYNCKSPVLGHAGLYVELTDNQRTLVDLEMSKYGYDESAGFCFNDKKSNNRVFLTKIQQSLFGEKESETARAKLSLEDHRLGGKIIKNWDLAVK